MSKPSLLHIVAIQRRISHGKQTPRCGIAVHPLHRAF